MANEANTLATKYRPSNYREVVGQDQAVKILKSVAKDPANAPKALFISGPFGTGKCVAGHTRVLSENGYKRIRDILPNSEEGFNKFQMGVLQEDLRPRQTSHFYYEKNCKVNYLTTAQGYVLNGTAKHQINILDKKTGRPKLVRTDKIVEGDQILLKKGKTVMFPNKLDSKEGLIAHYLLGFYLGDGYIENKSNKIIHYQGTKADCKEIQRLEGNKRYKLVRDKRREDLWRYSIRENESALSIFSLEKSDAFYKEIPEEVFSRTVKERSALLLGYFAADGSVDERGSILEYGTRSERLSEGIRDILFTLGVIINTFEVEIEGKPFYRSSLYKCFNNSIKYLFDLVVDYGSINLYQTRMGRILSMKRFTSNPNERANIYRFSDKVAKQISTEIRIIRRNSKVKYKRDLGSIVSSNVLTNKSISERTIENLHRFYGELPISLEGLTEWFCSPVTSISFKIEDVYDLSVPDTKVFMAQYTLNHNTTLARIFAKSLACDNFLQRGDVCRSCPKCQKFGQVSDRYIEYDSADVGNVEDIKSLRGVFDQVTDYYRVITLDECHLISPKAQSALLKIIEEGSPKTFFVLCTTDPDKVLKTIQSRSLPVDLTLIDDTLMVERMSEVCGFEKYDLPSEEILKKIALKADGHMRNAMMTLSAYILTKDEGVISLPVEEIKEFFGYISMGNIEGARGKIPAIMAYPVHQAHRSLNYVVMQLVESYATGADNGFKRIADKFGQANLKFFKMISEPWVTEAFKDEYLSYSFFLTFLKLLSKR
jgi:DNA polymerase III delta prime subunit